MSKEYSVVVDSMADFPVGYENPDVKIVPTPVRIGEKDFTRKDVDTFYLEQKETFKNNALLRRSGKYPTPIKTSMPNSVDLMAPMKEILKRGKDAIYVATASTLTSAYQSGRIACDILNESEEYEKRAICIDGLSMSALTSVLVEMALKKCETTKEFLDLIFDKRNDTEHFFAFEDYEAARDSGRYSNTTLALADFIGIRPLMRFDFDETGIRKAFCEKKARGLKMLCVYAVRKMVETIDPDYNIATVVHAQNYEGAKMLCDTIRKFSPLTLIKGDPDLCNNTYRMGQATGVHLGHSAIGLAFMRRKGFYEPVELHRDSQSFEEAVYGLTG